MKTRDHFDLQTGSRLRGEGGCSDPSWRSSCRRNFLAVLLWPVVLATTATGAPYCPSPIATNVWPCNLDLVLDACQEVPAAYVIAGGVFNTSTLTAPPSVGSPGATLRTRMEMTPTGPVAVFSFPSLIITGAVTAVGTNPMVLEACETINLYTKLQIIPGELGGGQGGGPQAQEGRGEWLPSPCSMAAQVDWARPSAGREDAAGDRVDRERMVESGPEALAAPVRAA